MFWRGHRVAMDRKNVDVENLTVTGKNASEGVTVEDDVIIIINQAYGPGGETLIGVGDESFDGFPAITLHVRAKDEPQRGGLVHISPIHGDRRKSGFDDFQQGEQLELLTPKGTPLVHVGHIDGTDADYFAIYLSNKLDQGPAVYVSNVWAHYHSRVVDQAELISVWAAALDAEAEREAQQAAQGSGEGEA